ncbi:hypothetical protein ACKWWX_004269 [Klebsiella oxytoca]
MILITPLHENRKGVLVCSRFVKTDSGYAILDMSLRPGQGDIVLIRYDGMTDFGRLMGQSLITRDGEAIDGDAMDDVHALGVVTFTIIDVRQDEGAA